MVCLLFTFLSHQFFCQAVSGVWFWEATAFPKICWQFLKAIFSQQHCLGLASCDQNLFEKVLKTLTERQNLQNWSSTILCSKENLWIITFSMYHNKVLLLSSRKRSKQNNIVSISCQKFHYNFSARLSIKKVLKKSCPPSSLLIQTAKASRAKQDRSIRSVSSLLSPPLWKLKKFQWSTISKDIPTDIGMRNCSAELFWG